MPCHLLGRSICKISKQFYSYYLPFAFHIPFSLHTLPKFVFPSFSVRLMAIMDHFGYYTHPLRDHDDPLWYSKEDYLPWLEHMKDNKRLHIIKHPSVAGELNKRLSCTEKKIKSKLTEIKLEEGESSTVPPLREKVRAKRNQRRRNTRGPRWLLGNLKHSLNLL